MLVERELLVLLLLRSFIDMKALISPEEVFTWTWVTSWKWGTVVINGSQVPGWVPDITQSIEDCQRVAEVEPDDKVFEVAQPLHWVSCPDDCVADVWYFKDGEVHIKPTDVPRPEDNT
jgi:hypothetical protein